MVAQQISQRPIGHRLGNRLTSQSDIKDEGIEITAGIGIASTLLNQKLCQSARCAGCYCHKGLQCRVLSESGTHVPLSQLSQAYTFKIG